MSPSSHRSAAFTDDSTPDPASSVRTVASGEPPPQSTRRIADHFLPYAQRLESEHPGYLALLGTTPAEYASSMADPGRTVEEAVAAGLLSAAEARFIGGCATGQDLIDLGHLPAEIDAILEDQRARAPSRTASSR
jgi:hypothetical protein